MELKRILENIWQDRSNDSIDGLKNQGRSEDYLQQAYEGRYLFELIQNGRDAAKSAEINGILNLDLSSTRLAVSNSGAAFNESGVRSVTLIGESPKGKGGFIGFKGIGFKSIQEISDSPRVITEHGTILFNKEESFKKLPGKFKKAQDLPLFFLPHFDEERLAENEIENNIVTRIELPLKNGINTNVIIESFKEIGPLQVLLLGSLERITFSSYSYNTTFIIQKRTAGKISVFQNGVQHSYKLFSPKERIAIPRDFLEQLPEKEGELYGSDPFVDISIAIGLDDHDRLIRLLDSKLYLFYPLKISSGFSFIIHSHFLVDPQRTTLRPSPLNKFILEKIAEYIAGQWLSEVRKNHASTFLNFLVFVRNKDSEILHILYDKLVELLKNQRFIYDSKSKKTYFKNDVIIADGFDRNLFPDNKINGKRLVYIDNADTVKWLRDEFRIEYLDYRDIEEHIEGECIIQAKGRNLPFFQHLYDYVGKHSEINLSKRKVLVTQNWELFSGVEEVFNGMDKQQTIQIPVNVRSRIHILHPGIEIKEPRQIKDRLGFIEYTTDALVRRLLNLYSDKKILPQDILAVLLSMQITPRSLVLVKSRIKLPVNIKDKTEWLNPLTTPIYISSPELEILYPNGNFLNLEIVKKISNKGSDLIKKLIDFGAWKIPALYYKDVSRHISTNDSVFAVLKNISGYSTPFFTLQGDWILDFPQQTNNWFTGTIIDNWAYYKEIISDEDFPKLIYRSQSSEKRTLAKENNYNVSTFRTDILSKSWIHISNPEGVKVSEVLGINRVDKGQRINILKQFFKLLILDITEEATFIRDSGLLHLDKVNLRNFEGILTLVFHQYRDLPATIEPFRKCYNVILNKFFEAYSAIYGNKDEILRFRVIPFLCKDESTRMFSWRNAQEIYYLDNKSILDLYPPTVQKLIQPQFSLHDKTRFGQIARRIGINFRSVITEKLQVPLVNGEVAFVDYIPFLPQCLALIESLLEDQSFETKVFTKLSRLYVKQTDNLEVDIWKGDQLIDTFSPDFRVIRAEDIPSVYAIPRKPSQEKRYNAGLLSAVIAEMIDRDFQRIESMLVDYYYSSDMDGYLKRNMVNEDRIEEITELIRDKVFNSKQSFWNQVLKLRRNTQNLDWVTEQDIDTRIISEILGIAPSTVFKISAELDYENISTAANLVPMNLLLSSLGMTLSTFKTQTSLNISFLNYFRKQYETVKYSYRPTFEKLLLTYLSRKGIPEKQNLIDELNRYNFMNLTVDDDIEINAEELFEKDLSLEFPQLTFSFGIKSKEKDDFLNNIYNTNYASLIKILKEQKLTTTELDNFLLTNKHRSLLYFKALEEISLRYAKWLQTKKTHPNPASGGRIDLTAYFNPNNLKITQSGTRSVDNNAEEKAKNGNTNGGRRVVGGTNQSYNNLVGIVAEKMVYEALRKEYDIVEWVSANAATAKVNSEGHDEWGYDIYFINKDGQTHYVEVKGTSGSDNYFFISSPEIKFAKKNDNFYHLFFVTDTLVNTLRKIEDLGNPFLIQPSESIFNNGNFTAVFDTLRITFQPKKP